MPQLMNVDDSSNVVAIVVVAVFFFSVRFRFADLVRVHHETTDSVTRRRHLVPGTQPRIYYNILHTTGCRYMLPSLFVYVLSKKD